MNNISKTIPSFIASSHIHEPKVHHKESWLGKFLDFATGSKIRGVIWDAPWKMILSCDGIFSFIWNASIWFWKWEKWGISNISNIEKWGISNNSRVINFITQKEPKMKFFDFGTCEMPHLNGKMPSHDKIIFRMFFGAFHITPHFRWHGVTLIHYIAKMYTQDVSMERLRKILVESVSDHMTWLISVKMQ